MKSAIIALGTLFLAATIATAQTDPPPGGIKLLPGYHHRTEQGIDSRVGTISSEGGLKIEYDIGRLAGNYADCGDLCGWTKGEVWRRNQTVNGQKVICVFTKDKRLIVSFPQSYANFVTTVNNESDLADVFLMLLTFHPDKEVE